MKLDPFTVTVAELRAYLADKPPAARVLVTPERGDPFGVVGWCVGEAEEGPRVILTGGQHE